MEVSSFKLSDDLAHQTSTKTKILQWMQDNPALCKNTNASKLSRFIHIKGVKPETVHQEIHKMVNNQMLIRYGTKFSSRFIINYLHKDLPKEILDRAPNTEKDYVKRTNDYLKSNQTLTPEGCILTKPTKKQTVTPTVEATVDGKSLQLTITINLNLGNNNA